MAVLWKKKKKRVGKIEAVTVKLPTRNLRLPQITCEKGEEKELSYSLIQCR